MAGKLFYRERRKVEEGEKKPRYTLVAVTDVDLKTHVKHLRKKELEMIAAETGAQLVKLEWEEKGHKSKSED
jgi:hypothetical protein